jgi:hypothetical protein
MASPSPKPFGTIPRNVKQQPELFEVHFEQQQLDDMKTLIRLSPIAKETFENKQQDGRFGVTRKWMVEAKEYWEKEFDWYILSHPLPFPLLLLHVPNLLARSHSKHQLTTTGATTKPK